MTDDATLDTDDGGGVCADCGEFFEITQGLDPTPICNLCAQVQAAAASNTIAALKRAEQERDRYRKELQTIADADPAKWEPDVRDQFRQWAQNRARAAIDAGRAT